MFRNYLLIAVRNLSKNFGYTLINVTGLAIGLASCLLVSLYVRFEMSFENFHLKKENIYRYVPRSEKDGAVYMQTMVPAGFGPFVKDNFKEIEMFSRFAPMDERPLLKYGDKILDAKPLALADPDFFEMFSFKLTQGSLSDALSKPFNVVITKSIADKFFPNGE